jgi:hypothetical protein
MVKAFINSLGCEGILPALAISFFLPEMLLRSASTTAGRYLGISNIQKAGVTGANRVLAYYASFTKALSAEHYAIAKLLNDILIKTI